MEDTVSSGLRRLRFDLDVREDESVPGVIARGVAGHHLLRLRTILREASAGRYAGLTQLADPSALVRLARVVRIDVAPLVAQAGRRLIEPGHRRLQHFVDFDGLVLPRAHLELRRRRISPLALLDGDHHRQAWIMSLLPFCPRTLERLVDTCPLCGFALGWVESVGIARCERCLGTVPPTPLPALHDALADSYRLFAGLLSLRSADRELSVAAMPARLRGLAPGELARLAMRCGLDCTDGDEKRAWQTRAGRLAPDRIAETAVRGIDLLRSWPNGIAGWAADHLAEATDDKTRRRDLRTRIRRIAWGDSGFRDQRALLGEIFPNLEPATAHPGADAFCTGREANRRLPGFREHAAEIRRLGIVPHRSAPSGGAHLYSAQVVDAAVRGAADAISISSVMDELKLPLYAIEQLFAAKLLARQDDPLLALILRRPMATASTYRDFVSLLRRNGASRSPPVTAIPLAHESHRIGGHAKPWSDIYGALVSGRLTFWLAEGISSADLLVARGSLDTYLRTPPRSIGTVAADMSTTDAAELLNVIPGNVRKLRYAGILPHSTGMRAKTTPRAYVEKLAAEWVSAAEMARRARTSAEHVKCRLRSLGFESHHGLWRRSEVLYALPLR